MSWRWWEQAGLDLEGAAWGIRRWKTSAKGEELRTYRMSFPDKGDPRSCLVE